jgi:DNA-binding beta-propeller fold protein YncE
VLSGPRPQVEFSRPAAVAVAGERVYVADTGLGVVHLLDLAARQYQVIRGAPTDPLRIPIDLIVVGNQLLVVDRGRACIDLLDLNGLGRASRRWSELAAPVAIAWDAAQQRYWLADTAAHACFASPDLRNWPVRLGERGTAPGQFNFPTALTWHAQVGLVVADAMNFRVQVFDESDQVVAVFGSKGDAAGDFARPRAVAVDSDRHIYVLDNQFENIQIFEPDGRLLMAFGQEGSGPGEFSLPSGLAIDDQDRIWVADSSNRRVQVFQYLSEKPS